MNNQRSFPATATNLQIAYILALWELSLIIITLIILFERIIITTLIILFERIIIIMFERIIITLIIILFERIF